MKNLPIIIIVLCSYVCRADMLVTSVDSKFGGETKTARIFLSALDKAPLWEDLNTPPPLLPNTAVQKALQYAATIKHNEGTSECVGDITLKNLRFGKWFYIVEVSFEKPGVLDGLYSHLNIVILMDGSVVTFS